MGKLQSLSTNTSILMTVLREKPLNIYK